MILDDPALDGVAAVLFDEFHERSLDADLGLALARDAQQGLRDDLQAAGDVGDARRRARRGAAWRRAGGREPRPRLSGRDALSRPRSARTDRAAGGRRGACARCAPSRARCWCSCPAQEKSAAPRRCCRSASPIRTSISSRSTARSTRASRTAPSRRRRRAGARWCWRPRSPRPRSPSKACAWSIDSGLARVPRYEPDVGLTRLETVRVSRAAADQRRGRAGRTEPGVCYRLWDEPQTGSLEPYTRPEILSADLSSLRARSGAMGRRPIRARSPFSTRRRRPRLPKRGRCSRTRRARRATAASPRRAARCARCRCRRGLRAWWSMPRREGAGELAAEIAAMLTERGLGGDDVDLRASARSVPPRPLAPRRGSAARWRSAGLERRRARARARCAS